METVLPLDFVVVCLPAENTNNLAWVIEFCQMASLDMTSVAVFTDRGCLLAPAVSIAVHVGLQLSLKYCFGAHPAEHQQQA